MTGTACELPANQLTQLYSQTGILVHIAEILVCTNRDIVTQKLHVPAETVAKDLILYYYIVGV